MSRTTDGAGRAGRTFRLSARSSCSTWSSTISTMWTSGSIACRAARFLDGTTSRPAAAGLPAAGRGVRGAAGAARREGEPSRAQALDASRPVLVLSSPDPEISPARQPPFSDVEQDALLLDALGTGPEAVVVIHVGGVYGDARASLDRRARSFEARPRAHGAGSSSNTTSGASTSLTPSSCTSGPVSASRFDLHHTVAPARGREDVRAALTAALDTWQAGVRPRCTCRARRPSSVGGRPPAASNSRPARRFPQSVGSPDASRRSRPTAGRHGRGEGEGSRRALGAAGSRSASGQGGRGPRRRGRAGASPARTHAGW